MKKSQPSFFLVPGFKMQAHDKAFSWLVSFLAKKGANVIKTPVHWDNRTLSRNADEFIEFFNKHKTEENYVLGFSYGAVIALLSANALMPKKIFLCSLSSDFSEDSGFMDASIRKCIGKRRCEETARFAKRSKLAVIKDAPHAIDFPAYVEAIKREIPF